MSAEEIGRGLQREVEFGGLDEVSAVTFIPKKLWLSMVTVRYIKISSKIVY
jgi:hypothetical protein